MRCRSFRIYLVLVVGTVFGFVLSSLLQSYLFSVAVEEKTLHSRTLEFERQTDSTHISFENLKVDGSNGNEIQKDQNTNQNQIGEDYLVEEKLDLDMEEAITNSLTDEQPKKQIYNMEQNWQGRNMQDLHVSQGPIDKLSDELSPRKSLMIAIITSVHQLMSQTIAIHGTWGKEQKNILYFTGDVQNMPHLPHGMEVIQLEGVDDKQAKWEIKEFAVFKYLIDHHSDQVDWFIIVGDDTYVKVKAMKSKMEEFNPSFNVYMGVQRSGDDSLQCDPSLGIVYSRGLLARLEPYLPQCLGEGQSIGDCITQRGIHCTRAKEVSCLLISVQSHLVLCLHSRSLFPSYS